LGEFIGGNCWRNFFRGICWRNLLGESVEGICRVNLLEEFVGDICWRNLFIGEFVELARLPMSLIFALVFIHCVCTQAHFHAL
jgi:hypothetical protein